jgi:hypothetical protein
MSPSEILLTKAEQVSDDGCGAGLRLKQRPGVAAVSIERGGASASGGSEGFFELRYDD